LSTHAKITEDEDRSEVLFKEAYEKIDMAINWRTGNPNIEQCNYAMTLVSHAIKREKIGKSKEEVSSLYKQAKEKLSKLLSENDPWSMFCLSRVYAAKHKPEKCRSYLSRCIAKGYLRKATKWQLLYFDNVKNFEWFKEMMEIKE